MTSFLKSMLLGPVFLVAIAGHASAQVTAEPDLSGVSLGCLSLSATVELCQNATGAYAVSVLPLPVVEADQALVDAAVLIAEGMLTEVCIEQNPIPIAGLQVLAGEISDPVLSAQVLDLIEVVSACSEIPVAAIGAPTLASPN